jgi:Ctr copper transporter family
VTDGGTYTMPTTMPGASSSSMSETFSDWGSYQLQLLFRGWNIDTPWQFTLTWFAILLLVACLHLLECASTSMKHSMLLILRKRNKSKTSEAGDDSSDSLEPTGSRPFGWILIKMIFGTISGIRYGLSLMLMLIATSYNPSIFVALVLGFFVGDFLCCDFHVNSKMGSYNTVKGGPLGPSITSVLCINDPADEDDQIVNV